MYYAITDSFTGDNPPEYTSGFANTGAVIAFRTIAQRDNWLKSTKLLTAKSISRKEALELTKWDAGDYYGKRNYMVKAVRVYGEYQESNVSFDNENVYHIIAIK